MPDGISNSGPDWIQLDRIIEQIGEDPGRYLDGPLDPMPRIRGLSSIHECRAWDGAERRIAKIRNRTPRRRIITALEQREAFLEDYEPDPDFERDVPEKTVLLKGEPYDEVDRSDPIARISRTVVATDGGEFGGK